MQYCSLQHWNYFLMLKQCSVVDVQVVKVKFNAAVVHLVSSVQLFETPWTAAHQAPLSSITSHSLLKFMSFESVTQFNHLILCCPLVLLHSIFPSMRIFSNESALHIRWSKYWSFSFSISPSKEYSGLISFRTDWIDLPPVQGDLKSLLQHLNSKASVLWYSAFFMVQLSYPYVTTGKVIALTMLVFDGKVISLLFNEPSRFVIAFLLYGANIFKFYGCSHCPQ